MYPKKPESLFKKKGYMTAFDLYSHSLYLIIGENIFSYIQNIFIK